MLASILAAGLAGCGNERASAPNGPEAPSRTPVSLRFARAGLQVQLPQNTRIDRELDLPAVFRASLGEPFASAYAYRRTQQLPRNDRELQAARRRLTAVASRRDATYTLRRSRLVTVAGARGVELLGDQTLARRRFTIRSLHLFDGNGEYVVEVAAPVSGFARFDGPVSGMVRRTLKLSGRVAGTSGRP